MQDIIIDICFILFTPNEGSVYYLKLIFNSFIFENKNYVYNNITDLDVR